MFVILYNPGAGGDMVTAAIDKTDYMYTSTQITPFPNTLRSKIRLTSYDTEPNLIKIKKEELFVEASKKYIAISEHDSSFFINSCYDIILIDDSNYTKWTLDRVTKIDNFNKKLFHNTHNTVADRLEWIDAHRQYTDKVITFDDMINGNLLDVLSKWVSTPLNTSWYPTWIKNRRTEMQH